MKRFSRKVSSILLILFLCLAALPITTAQRADGAGVLPRALPDSGTYDRHQKVSLLSEDGASITYSVYGRATVPKTSYTSPVLIEESVTLSVYSTKDGVTAHKDFVYVINPRISSTYPADGGVDVSLRPTIAVEFSREMNEAALEDKNNITIAKAGTNVEVDRSNFSADYTSSDNTLRITLSVDLGAGSAYTVSLRNIVDSNGGVLQGNNSFSFTTVPSKGYTTYGTVTTNLTYYDNVSPEDTVQIRGTFVRDGKEVTADPLNPPLQVRVIDPDGIINKTIDVTVLDKGRFSASYTIADNSKQGAWTMRLYDNGDPRQLLSSCTFSIGPVAAPAANKEGGTYYEPIVLGLITTTPGATIYYTTDDVIPDSSVDSSCTPYRGSLTISSNTTVRAVAIKGGVKSGLTKVTYTIKTELGVLTFVPARVPGNHPAGVSVNTGVSVNFGRPVKADTVKTNFSLIECDENHNDVAGAYVAGTVTYDAMNRKATFTPAEPLKPYTHYRGILGTGIEDLDGVHLSANVDDDWIFQTGSGQDITVDGMSVTGNFIAVNKNPATIEISFPDASIVTVNGARAVSTGNNKFISNVPLSPGNNVLTIVVTDNQAIKNTTLITVNYLNLLQDGAAITASIPAKGKLEMFDKQVLMNFPKGTYLKDADGRYLNDQSFTVAVLKNSMPEGFPAVSLMYSIQPKTSGAELNNKGEASLTLTYGMNVSAASAASLTILCDTDNDGVWDENLGGKVDAKKRIIMVPFGYFGRYVVVNKIWPFADYSTIGWAKTYVEYLWSKGIMKPLPTATAGQFGLADPHGREIAITRGEFAVMMGRALALNKLDYTQYGIFADMKLSGTSAYAKDRDGYWRSIDDDDYKYIDLLARNGIISGSLDSYGNQVFNYHDFIIREEVTVLLARAMNLTVETEDAKVRAAITKLYTDAETSISTWAQPYVLTTSKGYFGGFPDKTFKGQDSFTRPQAARLVYQIMKKAKLM